MPHASWGEGPVWIKDRPRALARYCLTGERFGSAEAARIGLLTTAGADVDDVLEPVLDGLRRASPRALAETKHLLTTKVLENFDLDAGELTRLSSRLFASADAREGMAAFLERREPGWVL
ncbi:enoyl-CoA hydratase-related protein [Streptomyces europaeiscabiei]|nr:enoyl-CoA hydratase-related protein [Streptomyces europaeiscabiei]MDX2764732.1 enoyl-CoA hydratase-related protein [Streptomyces europaeiscabiei]